MFFDSHAHIASDELYPHIDAIIERAQKKQYRAHHKYLHRFKNFRAWPKNRRKISHGI